MKKLPTFLSLLVLLTAMGTASASAITLDVNHQTQTFSGEANAVPGFGQYEFAASATFTLTSNTFTLVLTNTSSQAVTAPAQLLSAIFWSSNTTLTPLTPFAAALTNDSVWVNPDNKVALNVGGNYAYSGSLNLSGKTPAPANQGVSAVGMDLFGNGNFDGKPVHADGDAYTILPHAGIAARGNAFDKKYYLADDSMTFTFHTKANAITIDDVIFHYSSEYGGVNLAAVPSSGGGGNQSHAPLPPTALLLGSGLLGLGLLGFRKKSQA